MNFVLHFVLHFSVFTTLLVFLVHFWCVENTAKNRIVARKTRKTA